MFDNLLLSVILLICIDKLLLSFLIYEINTVVFWQHIFFEKPTPPMTQNVAAVYYIYIHGTAGHPYPERHTPHPHKQPTPSFC
jgi:hypothetical protein